MITIQNLLNNTNNEYTLQSVYSPNSYIGTITELSQVFLAIYDTSAQPFVNTDSETIDITDNHISLRITIKNIQRNRVKSKSIR